MARILRFPPGGRSLADRLRSYADGEGDDVPPAEFLRELVLEFKDPGPELARLCLLNGDKDVAETAIVLIAVAAMEPLVPRAVRARFAEAAAPVWKRAIADGTVPPDRIERLLPLLSLLGVEPTREELARLPPRTTDPLADAFRGVEAGDLEGLEDMLRAAKVLPDAQNILETVDAGDLRDTLPLVGRALQTDRGAAVVLASVTAAVARDRGLSAEEVGPLLEEIARTGSPSAAWYLGELGRWPGGGEVGARAAALAEGMLAQGVRPSLPDPGKFVRGVATAVDGSGTRSLLLLRRNREGGVRGLSVLWHETRGLLDAWYVHEGGEQLEAALRRSKLVSATVGLPFLRSLLGEMFHAARARGCPLPGAFLLHRPFFGEEPVEEREHVPDPGIPPGDASLRGPIDVEGTEVLADRTHWEEFWFSSPAVYALLGKLLAKPLKKRGGPEALRASFVREVLPGERAWLLRKVDQLLEVESLAGVRGRKAAPGRRLRRALAAEEFPMDAIPFVEVMMLKSVAAVGANIARGYRSQEEANRAAIDEDDAEMEEEREEEEARLWGLEEE